MAQFLLVEFPTQNTSSRNILRLKKAQQNEILSRLAMADKVSIVSLLSTNKNKRRGNGFTHLPPLVLDVRAASRKARDAIMFVH
jgi:hypothetical protein